MRTYRSALILLCSLAFLSFNSAQNDIGIFRSEDGGLTWKASTSGFPPGEMVSEFLIHGDKLFAGTNDAGLFVSEDDGVHWSKIGKNLPGKITALGKRGKTLFAAPWREGVYVSTDGGKNWHERNFGLANKEVWSFFTLGNSVFVGTSTGIYYTWNDGQTWMEVHQAAQVNDFTQFGNKLYAATANGILQSSDYGKHWTKILENKGVYELNSNEYGVFALTYRQGIMKSTDGDTVWESCNNGLSALDQHTFAIAHIGHTLMASQLDGIYVSTTRGIHWTKTTSPFSADAIAMRLFKVSDKVLIVVINTRNNVKC